MNEVWIHKGKQTMADEDEEQIMQLIQRWKFIAARVDEIVYTPVGLGKLHEPYAHIEEIRSIANQLQTLSAEQADLARAAAERLTVLVQRWERTWWPPGSN